MDDYLTVAEFAKRLHVSHMTIRRMITHRTIMAINVGTTKRKKLRIPPSQFAVVEKRLAV